MAREKDSESVEKENAIVAPTVPMFSSGSTLLDAVLGGGWAEGRVANIVGDRSTNKTGVLIEACINFCRKHPKGKVRYRETEAAFADSYAEQLGLDLKRVDLRADGDVATVEKWYADLKDFASEVKSNPGLYLLDSLDALSDEAEMGREVGEKTFGTQKAKMMSEVFRKIIRDLNHKNITVLIVSQIRDKIGAMMGETQGRSGGKALDFYASQVIWVNNMGKIDQTIKGVKRVTGVNIRARCKKNKVGLPFRECEFPVMFSYGIDDLVSMVEWLSEIKCLNLIGMTDTDMSKSVKAITKLPDEEYAAKCKEISKVCKAKWREIDNSFMPTRKKY